LGKRRKRRRGETAYINILVTAQVLREAERVAWTEGYTDVSDYVRDLIRKDFKERGVSIRVEEQKAEEAA